MSLLQRARIAAVALVLFLLAAGIAAPTPARAATTAAAADPVTVEDILDLLTYRVNTTAIRNDAVVTKTTDALVGVPMPVDVDNALVPVPDLVVEVLPLPPSLVAVTIQRTSPGTLPLKAELQFDLPGSSNPGLTYGYDTLTSSAPTTFVTSLSFSRDETNRTVIDANVTNIVSSSPLAVIGALFNRGTSGPVDPLNARVEFSPTPTSLSVHVDSNPAASSTVAQITSTSPAKVTADVIDTKGARTRNLHAVIDQLPQSATVNVTNTRVTYQASSPIKFLDATLNDTGGATNTQILATANDVPTAIDFVHDSPTHMALTTNGRIGNIEGGFATGRAVEKLADAGHYVNAITGADGSTSVAAQVVGLKSFDANLGDPVAVTATVDSVPLHAHLVDPARTLDVTTSAVPSTVAVSFSPTAGVAEYHASAAIKQIKATIDTTTPFLDRATHGEVTINTVPKDLRFDFGPRVPAAEVEATFSTRAICVPDENTECPDPEPPTPPGDDPIPPPPPPAPSQDRDDLFVFDANGASIGSIDVLLTSGGLPAKPLAAAEDGVVLDQTATTFKLQGRISGLKKVVAHIKVIDDIDVTKRITRRNTFEAHLDPTIVQSRTARLELNSLGINASAVLSRLPTDINSIEIVDTKRVASLGVREETLQSVTYDASAPIGSIDVDVDTPALPNPLSATILQAPKQFTFCKATDGACNDEPGPSQVRDNGSFLFDADAPVTLSAFLCLTPATSTCDTRAEAQSGFQLTNVSVKHVAYELHFGTFSNENPLNVLFDTAGTDVSGKIDFFVKDKVDVDLNFPGNSFAGNAAHSLGLQITNAPPIRTNQPLTLLAPNDDAPGLITKTGGVVCGPTTEWRLVIPVLPNPLLNGLICE